MKKTMTKIEKIMCFFNSNKKISVGVLVILLGLFYFNLFYVPEVPAREIVELKIEWDQAIDELISEHTDQSF